MALAEKYPGLRPTRCTSLYRALISSIIKQRIPLRVALGIEAELVSRMGRRARILGKPAYGLPEPERLLEAGVEWLRSLGLFRLKAEAVVEVARAEIEGRLPRRPWEDVEDAVRELTRIRGVGRWTAELAIAVVSPGFRVGPTTDLAVRRGLQRLLGISEREAVGILGELEEYAGLIMYLAAHDYEKGKGSKRRGGGQGHG